MDGVDWNDLRYVAAVAKHRSAAAAARVLGVSHATVLRRVQALEREVGAVLFDRLATGYEPTIAGQQLALVGASIDRAMTETRRSIDGQTTELSGTIRFTTTDSFGCLLMPSILSTFRRRYPTITVDMVVTNAQLDLDRRDADVALRPTSKPPESWVGMRLLPLDWALYAAAEHMQQQKDWKQVEWIALSGPGEQSTAGQWMRQHLAPERIVASVDSFIGLRELALLGVGAAVLPCFMGHDRMLCQLHRLPPSTSPDIWLLTHANLRQNRRIRAFMEHVAQCVRAQRARFQADPA